MRTAAGWAVTFASLGVSGAATRSRAAEEERIIGAAPWEAETRAQAGRNIQGTGPEGGCQADFGDPTSGAASALRVRASRERRSRSADAAPLFRVTSPA